MSRQVEIISTSEGKHFILFGFNENELSSFRLQMWITHYGKRAIDFVQSLSLSMITFMGGDIWISNSNDVPRCSLFGEQRDSKVGIVANQEPNVIKLLDSIGIHSDSKWEVESITVPVSSNYPNGQYSRIPKERFKKREGVYTSEFLRNGKTTSATIKPIEYIKGEALRGESAYIVLKNTETSETKLFSVDINLTKSR
jgi:hypothetical protein